MSNEPVITVDGVWFSYDSSPVLENVNLSIGGRDFVCVVGPNGGGKTTLIKLFLGLLRPTKGTVRVFGKPPEDSRLRLGYMPQHAQLDPLFPVRVIDVVLMGRMGITRKFGPYRKVDRKAALDALNEVEMQDLFERRFSTLSGGQQQRVLIARALASDPEVLLLDEPTASLDLQVECELYELLRLLNERLTVIIASHDLGFVSRYVKSVICVKREVVAHPTNEITGELIRELYGEDVCMVRHDQHASEGAKKNG